MTKNLDFNKLNEQAQLRIAFKTATVLSEVEFKNTLKDAQIKLSDKYIIKISGNNHAWLSFKKEQRKLYSPQLHLEYLKAYESDKKSIKGTFGPDPNLWTMFMFIHFFLGIIFIALLMWFYTNYSLGNSNVAVYSLMATISLLWIALYIFARQNRLKGKDQAKELYEVYQKIIH